MSQLTIVGTVPASTTGELAGGPPGGAAVTTLNDYYRWLDTAVKFLPSTAQTPPPVLVLEQPWSLIFNIGVLQGGCVLIEPEKNRVPADFEYQITGYISTWTTCLSWEVPVPNQNLPAGSVAIRAKATSLLTASTPVFNRTTLPKCSPPVSILSVNGQAYTNDLGTIYHAPDKIVVLQIEAPGGGYVRLQATAGIWGYHLAPIGISTFTQRVAGNTDGSLNVAGQRRFSLELQYNDYNTRKFIVNLDS